MQDEEETPNYSKQDSVDCSFNMARHFIEKQPVVMKSILKEHPSILPQRTDDCYEECGMNQSTAIVYRQVNKKLTTMTLMKIFSSIDSKKVSTVCPHKPKAGCLYIYESSLENQKSMLDDKYRWRSLGSNKSSINTKFYVRYFSILVPNSDDDPTYSRVYNNGFQRTVYQPRDKKQRYLAVHYTGDHRPFENYFPHKRKPLIAQAMLKEQQEFMLTAKQQYTKSKTLTAELPADSNDTKSELCSTTLSPRTMASGLDQEYSMTDMEDSNLECLQESVTSALADTGTEREDRGVSVVYKHSQTRLLKSEVIQLFSNIDTNKVSTAIAFKPTGGSLYVYDDDCSTDWPVDGYRWKNLGTTKIPRTYTMYHTTSYSIVTLGNWPGQRKSYDNGFQRIAYKSCADIPYIIVHYIGDHKLYKPLAHGNSHNKDIEYIPMLPSSCKKAAEMLKQKTATAYFNELETQKAVLGKGAKKTFERIRTKVLNEQRMAKNPGEDEPLELHMTVPNFERDVAVVPRLKLHLHIPDFIESVDIIPHFTSQQSQNEVVLETLNA